MPRRRELTLLRTSPAHPYSLRPRQLSFLHHFSTLLQQKKNSRHQKILNLQVFSRCIQVLQSHLNLLPIILSLKLQKGTLLESLLKMSLIEKMQYYRLLSRNAFSLLTILG